MEKKIIVLIVLFCGIFMNSCNEDLLDLKQHGGLSPTDYYANATDPQANQLITEVYRLVYGFTDWGGMWNGYSDDAAVGNANINANSQNSAANGLYTNLYRVNYLCNLIIERLSDDSALKKQVIGEAYFWRGWANLYLIRLFGTPPLVDHVLSPSELQPPNGDPVALWNYVQTSLTTAISMLPEKAGLGAQSAIGGRVTKHSAYALLGKAQVIKGDFAAAIPNLEAVINSGKYKLHPDFRQLYHIQADWSDEYIWEWNMNDADQANFLEEGDRRAVTSTWRTENVKVPGGFTLQGYGGADFSKGFYDFLIARGEQGQPRQLGTVWSYEDIQQRFISLGLAGNQTQAIAAFWSSVPQMANCQGYFRIKQVPWLTDMYGWVDVQQAHAKVNWPGMRYAEVELLYAEAALQTKPAQGLLALNDVRLRAGLTPLGSYMLQDVKDEKRAELAFEGERYLDLIRWGDAATALTGRGSTVYTFYGYTPSTTTYNVTTSPVVGAVGYVAGRDELFPIPYNETLLNTNLIQNKNWQ